jgi:ComF family protein
MIEVSIYNTIYTTFALMVVESGRYTLCYMPLLETVLSIFAPHMCVVCSTEGSLLCTVCSEFELLPVPSRCYRCKQLTRDSSVCASCRRHTALKHVWVRTEYTNVSSKLVLAYKFERARAAHQPLARVMVEALPFLPADTVIMSVPTTTSRVRERGYDHTYLIARDIAARTGLLHIRPAIRMGQVHQFGASGLQRRKQLENAFVVTKPQAINGKKILLVDDVVTTGATLETLAKTLKAAGAAHIDAVVFAQKV